MNYGKLDFNGSVPLYLQVANIIEKKVFNNEIKIGQKLPPQRQLRRIFGVSIDTIIQALSHLNREGYISARSKHGTSVINNKPKCLNLKRKNEIGLVVCSERNSYMSPIFYEIIKGIEVELKQKGLFLVYGSINEGSLSIEEKGVSGLIVTGSIDPGVLKVITRTKIPFVLIGDIARKEKIDLGCDFIVNDDYMSANIPTKHLAGLGHKKIVYIARNFRRYSWELEQLDGFRQALKEKSIDCDYKLLVETVEYTSDAGYRAINNLLKKSIKFTGLVCNGEILCYGALKAIRQKGLHVPEDISVVCMTATGLGVPDELTKTIYNCQEMGRRAVLRLIERLTKIGWQPQRIVVPNKLIVSESTMKIK